MKEERIVFMGTASFSLAVLKMLIEENIMLWELFHNLIVMLVEKKY